jgi:hypothetical protein
LKRKLEAMSTADVVKARRKATAPAAAKSQAKPAAPARQDAAKKVKRKLNLSPERRAQLAAAMKARWAAKRAAAETNPQDTSIDRDFTLGQVAQAP